MINRKGWHHILRGYYCKADLFYPTSTRPWPVSLLNRSTSHHGPTNSCAVTVIPLAVPAQYCRVATKARFITVTAPPVLEHSGWMVKTLSLGSALSSKQFRKVFKA